MRVGAHTGNRLPHRESNFIAGIFMRGESMADTELQVTAREGWFHHELRLNGESVSSLEVIDLVMRIGSSAVRMGGIGGVGTEGEHRNKGYARRVLENSNTWMEANGFDCATLFGIE